VAAPFPWLYSSAAERQPWRDREVLRPVVPVTIVGPAGAAAPRVGLVDTGAENVLAAAWLADLVGLDLSQNVDTALIGIGGQTAEVAFVEAELRLLSPDAGEEFISWRTANRDPGAPPGGWFWVTTEQRRRARRPGGTGGATPACRHRPSPRAPPPDRTPAR
jgi:hypothetical protein